MFESEDRRRLFPSQLDGGCRVWMLWMIRLRSSWMKISHSKLRFRNDDCLDWMMMLNLLLLPASFRRCYDCFVLSAAGLERCLSLRAPAPPLPTMAWPGPRPLLRLCNSPYFLSSCFSLFTRNRKTTKQESGNSFGLSVFNSVSVGTEKKDWLADPFLVCPKELASLLQN